MEKQQPVERQTTALAATTPTQTECASRLRELLQTASGMKRCGESRRQGGNLGASVRVKPRVLHLVYVYCTGRNM